MSLKSSLKTDVSSPLIEKKDSDFLLPSFGNSLKVKDQITEKKEKKQIESPEFSNSRENNENDIENIISERNYFEQKYIESQNSLKISMEKYENLLFKNQNSIQSTNNNKSNNEISIKNHSIRKNKLQSNIFSIFFGKNSNSSSNQKNGVLTNNIFELLSSKMEHSNEITEKLTIVLLELRKTIKDLKLKNKSLITQFDEINFKYNELIKSIKEKKTDVNEKHYKTQILEENFNFSQSLHDNSNFINDELNKKSQNTENIQTESNNKDQNKIQTESNINKQNSNDIEKNSKVLSSPEKIKNYEEAMVKLHQQKKSLKQKNDELLSKLVSLQNEIAFKDNELNKLNSDLSNKEKKIVYLENHSSRLETDVIKTRTKITEALNKAFENGTTDLVEFIERDILSVGKNEK